MSEPHPHRYPNHEGDKGSVYLGICNTTRCNSGGAEYFNNQTFGYYCFLCGKGINYYTEKGKIPICTIVDHDLTHDEMNELHKVAMLEFR